MGPIFYGVHLAGTVDNWVSLGCLAPFSQFPKLSQTKQKKDVAEGSVPQSRYDSSLFIIFFCVKDQPLISLYY
jgi:hypothetical protein